MKYRAVIGALLCLGIIGAAAAQDTDPTPTRIFGALATPAPQDIQSEPVIPIPADDARLTTCSAPTLPNFVPQIVRPGERLVDLLVGSDLTPAQAAALNCLDDPAALPVGAVIWLPETNTPETAPETGSAAPDIVAFEASNTAPLNQEGTVFRWQARGSAAYFYPCPRDSEDCPRPFNTPPQPLAGEMSVRGFQYAGQVRYRLEVVGAEGERVAESITLDVTCSHQSLALTSGFVRCPDAPPLASFAVWQPFEGGVMLYFADTGEIYVMTRADQRVQVFRDVFEEWMPSVEYPDIPDDRFAAIRGFGVVWNQLGGPGGALGWALAREGGIDTARQPAGRLSYTTYIRGAGAAVYAVTLVPGESVGYWMQVGG